MNTCARLARRFGIERVVQLGNLLMGWPEWKEPAPEAITAINSQTLKAVACLPDIFIGFCYLNPSNGARFCLDEMERCVVAGGMKGLKFEVSTKATDKAYDPIMERAQALGIPILHHAWYKSREPAKFESTPAEIADLARRFPKVPIIIAHLGGGRERGVLDVVDTPNVVYDTSGAQSEAGLVEFAVRQLGAHRVLYGSDWPIRDFGTQTGRILGARLTDEERELIFWSNAARLLKLEEVKT
jgi:predicted TIM-barrel fold metal-dependent hydrolase